MGGVHTVAWCPAAPTVRAGPDAAAAQAQAQALSGLAPTGSSTVIRAMRDAENVAEEEDEGDGVPGKQGLCALALQPKLYTTVIILAIVNHA